MNNNSSSFVDAIVKLLQDNQADQSVIDAYQAESENMNNSNALFLLLATFMEEKVAAVNKKTAKNPSGKKGKGKKDSTTDADAFKYSPIRG